MTDRHVSPKVHRDPPTKPQPWLDPDPLTVEPEPVDERIPYHGWELEPERPISAGCAWFGLGVCVGTIVMALLITVGNAVAAPRSAAVIPPTGTSADAEAPVASRAEATPGGMGQQPTGAPSAAPSLVATGGGTPLSRSEGPVPSPTGKVGSAIVAARGTWAYANASHGPRYLAIPEGPGWIVEVCGPLGCLERVSTDAGPELWLQRAGRIGDLSSADFRAICGPLSAGLCSGSYSILGAADQSGDDPPRDPRDDAMRVEDGGPTLPPTSIGGAPR